MPAPSTPAEDVIIDRDAAEVSLEEGLEGTFPASDPIAIVQPVHRVGARHDPPPEPRPGRGAGRRDRAR
jgi:hypothetical protein